MDGKGNRYRSYFRKVVSSGRHVGRRYPMTGPQVINREKL